MVLNVCGFVAHAVASRQLGVAAYGALYALINAALIAALPVAFVAPVVAQLAAEFRALHDDGHLRGLTDSIALWLCKTGRALSASGDGGNDSVCALFARTDLVAAVRRLDRRRKHSSLTRCAQSPRGRRISSVMDSRMRPRESQKLSASSRSSPSACGSGGPSSASWSGLSVR